MQRQYLSIDIGGTAIKSAQIDHSGNIIARARVTTPRQRQPFLAAIKAIIDQTPEVSAVCVSVPGIVNPVTGQVQFTGALAFMGNYQLAQVIKDYTHLPVYVGNDANCATLAEMWLGNLSTVTDGAVVTLGTSVGGGLVINQRLIHGPHFHAGELSAMIINHDDEDFHQSTMGASTSAVKMITAVAKNCGLPDYTDGRRAFVEINKKNPLAWDIFTDFCRRVAVLLINIQSVVDLDCILLGGGISAQPILITEVRHQFEKLQSQDRRLHDDVAMPVIKAAKFGNEANLLGALYGMLLKLEEQEENND